MQLFYHNIQAKEHDVFQLDAEESRHLIKVLRKKNGDEVLVTNGKGHLLECEVNSENSKKAELKVIRLVEKPKQRDYYLHLYIAPTKTNDRFEFFLEKATEIGIDEITPLVCEHSERKKIKSERYQKILVSAMKQSLQFHLPKLNDLTPFSEALQQIESGMNFVAHCEEEEQKKFLFSELDSNSNKQINILIGPEGDFSPSEIGLAKSYKFIPVSLGKNRLRTETAGVFAVQQVATKFES